MKVIKPSKHVYVLVPSTKDDFLPNVKSLVEVEDNGNGYHVNFPSHSSCSADRLMSLQYGDLEYLAKVWNKMRKEVKYVV